MTRQRPKCQVCGNGIHVAMFGRQWVHWSHLLDLDHKAVPPEPSQREAQDGSSGAGRVGLESGAGNARSSREDGGATAGRESPGVPAPEPFVRRVPEPLTVRQFDTIEADYERIWRRYA